MWSTQGCILFHRSWKPTHAQFPSFPKIFATKLYFFATHFALFAQHLSFVLFVFFSPFSPFFVFFSFFFPLHFPFYLFSWRVSKMVLKNTKRGGGGGGNKELNTPCVFKSLIVPIKYIKPQILQCQKVCVYAQNLEFPISVRLQWHCVVTLFTYVYYYLILTNFISIYYFIILTWWIDIRLIYYVDEYKFHNTHILTTFELLLCYTYF